MNSVETDRVKHRVAENWGRLGSGVGMVSEEIDLDRAGVKGLDRVSGWDWRRNGEI